jgi:cellobiose phosphorylase
MRVRIRNTRPRRAKLAVMPRLIPWLTGAQPAAWEMPWLYQSVRCEQGGRRVRFEMRSPGGYPEKRRRLQWMLDVPFERICLNEAVFTGRGWPGQPDALAQWEQWPRTQDQFAYGYPLFAALAQRVTLRRDETWHGTMLLADAAQDDAALEAALAQADREFTEIEARKAQQISRFSVRTPDPAFTRYVNEFLGWQQQLVLRRGWPCNMMGVRDAAQDYTGVVAWNPAPARGMLLTLLETERRDGWFVRQFSTDGRHGRHDERPYVDSGLWVWELVYEYVCQTRDFAVLDEALPFLDGEDRTPVLDHLARLLGYYLRPENLGEHGLCKIREGDWNDSVNRAGLEGRGETVMTSCHLVYCLRQAARLDRYLRAAGRGGIEGAEGFEALADAMRGRIRQAALNRRGFLNGVFSDVGRWFFSDADPDGYERFNTPVNAFGIIAGIFEPPEIEALCTYLLKLRRPYGYPLFSPPIGDPPMAGLGRIGSGDLMPGLGENGTSYNHGCHGFLGRALAAAGRGDMLYDVMLFLLPYDQARHPVQQARTAPYAVVNVYKSAPGREGEGGDAFFSGTIAVAVRNVYQGMLGVQAAPEGLSIRPCLPRNWKELEGRLLYAGKPLEVRVRRKGTGLEITANGAAVTDGWVPAAALGLGE